MSRKSNSCSASPGCDRRSEGMRIFGESHGLHGDEPRVAEWRPPSIDDLSRLPALPDPPHRPANPWLPEETNQTTGDTVPAESPAEHSPSVRRGPPTWVESGSVFEAVWQHPEDAIQLLRSMSLEDGEDGRAYFHRVAEVLISLGEEIAAEVIGPRGREPFSYRELRELSQAIIDTPRVTVEAQRVHLASFGQQLQAREWIRSGSVGFAMRAVEAAHGVRRARAVVEPVADSVLPRFKVLNDVPAAQISLGIVNEHPQTIALVLSHVEPKLAAEVLAKLPQKLQQDVSYRIATIDEPTPGAIRGLEENLEHSFSEIIVGKSEVGGPQVAAEMLKASDPDVERNVMDAIDNQAAELASVLRELGCRREEDTSSDRTNGDSTS